VIGPVYIIHLQAQPDHPAPPAVRLRRLLKIAGRALGLKCVKMVEQVPPPPRQRGKHEPAPLKGAA
jgi:hypothetical protein